MVSSTRGQGTFVYDQQSVNTSVPAGILDDIQPNEPIGQSFTPSLSAVGFVRLNLSDAITRNGVGAAVYVNLRTDSITGPVLGSTDPVSMPDNFDGLADFLFSAPVPVTAGATYYLQPVVLAGDTWRVGVFLGDRYPSGTEYYQGAVLQNFDFWFREGVVVPEPGSAWLLLVGIGGLSYAHRLRLRS
jgi:hypothetical protein